MNFGEWVEQTRKCNRLNQEDLLAGLNQYAPASERYKTKQTVSYWQHDQNLPRITWLGWIANRAPVESWVRGFAVRGIEILESQLLITQTVSDVAQPALDLTVKDDG
jgi:transcriptional regulator with XRE-family HTH domain